MQEEWRCLGEDDGYDWVLETHNLITYVENPQAQAAIDFDCPVIDPTDTERWCPNGIDFYPVPCKLVWSDFKIRLNFKTLIVIQALNDSYLAQLQYFGFNI